MTPQITPNRYSIGTLPFASVTIPWKSRQKKSIYIYIYSKLSSFLVRIGDSIALDLLPISSETMYYSPPTAKTKMLRQGVSSLPPPHPPPQTRRSARVAPKASEDQRVQRCAEIRPRSHAYISERNKNGWRNTPVCLKFCLQFFSQNLEGWGANSRQKPSSFELWQIFFFQFWGFWTTARSLRDLFFFPLKKIKPLPPWPCKSLPSFFKGSMGLAKCCENFGSSYNTPKKTEVSAGKFFKES